MNKVRVISYTTAESLKCVTDIVAYCARVSNPTNQMNTQNNEKLIRYLIKNKHWSPFEMVNICLEISTTRDIARQVLRHRTFSFQEFSQRYAEPTLTFTRKRARLQDKKNRQNSIETQDEKLSAVWDAKQDSVADASKSAYQWAISNGIAKEQARAVLPEGMTMSTMYMNGSVRSWIHYIEVRTANGTQHEHVELANACAIAISAIFPMILDFVGKS